MPTRYSAISNGCWSGTTGHATPSGSTRGNYTSRRRTSPGSSAEPPDGPSATRLPNCSVPTQRNCSNARTSTSRRSPTRWDSRTSRFSGSSSCGGRESPLGIPRGERGVRTAGAQADSLPGRQRAAIRLRKTTAGGDPFGIPARSVTGNLHPDQYTENS